MGTWDSGIFDNDPAYDLLEMVAEGNCTPVEEIIRFYRSEHEHGSLNAEDAAVSLAACYFVAASHGCYAPASKEALPKVKLALAQTIPFAFRTVAERLKEVDLRSVITLAECAKEAYQHGALDEGEADREFIASAVRSANDLIRSVQSASKGEVHV